MKEEIYMGKLIQGQMEKDGRKAKWLSDKIKCTPSDIYWMYQQKNITIEQLIKICIHLKTDFFSYYSAYIHKQVRFPEKMQYIDGEIHIGKLIKNQMEKEGRKAKWLADKIFCVKSNIYRIYQRKYIDIEQLIRICICMEIDFFANYSEYVCSQIQMRSNNM